MIQSSEYFTVEPTSSNAAEEACKLLLMELLKKDENSLLESRNVNVNEHHSDEKVEVSELRNLITSLGKSTPLQRNGSTFPKPSCGKVSESSTDGEESHKHILRKKKLKKKRGEPKRNNQPKKLASQSTHSVPSASAASKRSHCYGLPDFLDNLTSFKNVRKNVKNIIVKVFKKIKHSSSRKTEEKIKTESSSFEQVQNLSVAPKEAYPIVEKETLKRKASFASILDKDNVPSKVRKIDNITTLFTEVPKEMNERKAVIDDSLKVFGLSNLNPYQSVSFPFSNKEPSENIKPYEHESRFFENDSKPSPNISKDKKETLDSFLITKTNSSEIIITTSLNSRLNNSASNSTNEINTRERKETAECSSSTVEEQNISPNSVKVTDYDENSLASSNSSNNFKKCVKDASYHINFDSNNIEIKVENSYSKNTSENIKHNSNVTEHNKDSLLNKNNISEKVSKSCSYKSLEYELKSEDCNKTSYCGIAHPLIYGDDLTTTKQNSNLKSSNFAIDKVDKEKSEICLDPCNSIKISNKNAFEETDKEAITNDTSDYLLDFMWGESRKPIS